MDRIAVLIPCYNEEKTVEKVVMDFKKSLPDATIYVYDNNSTDKTAELAEKAGAIVRHEYVQGKGNVIRRMFRDINADCYIMTDGGPNNASLFYVLLLYKRAFTQSTMGLSCAMAWVLFIVVGIVTALNFISSRKWVYYGGA